MKTLPQPIDLKREMRKGVALVIIGICVSLALYREGNPKWFWGLVPFIIGISKLIIVRFLRDVPLE
jgi:hypothetical protein